VQSQKNANTLTKNNLIKFLKTSHFKLIMNAKAEEEFNKAETAYNLAENLLKEEKYPECVDQFQKTVEHALKSLLILYNIKYPPNHGITNFLPEIIEKIPESDPNHLFYSETVLPPFIAISTILLSIRNLANYSYQTKGQNKSIPASQIFNEGIAQSVSILFDSNYGLLRAWITDLLYQ